MSDAEETAAEETEFSEGERKLKRGEPERPWSLRTSGRVQTLEPSGDAKGRRGASKPDAEASAVGQRL
jgi:hypothetical protein